MSQVEREQILSRLRERIVAFAASRIGRDAAEDLAQDALLVIEEKYPGVAALEELLPLAFQILRFKMAAVRRKAARRGEYGQVSVDELPLADPGVSPLEDLERRRMLARLIEAMRTMGERCREIFRLKLEGKSFPEIQAILEVRSINTIYTWDARCRKQLLERLGGRWEP